MFFNSSFCKLFFLLLILNIFSFINALGEIIYAINAGGEAHVDINGIHYRRDPLHGKIGTASDYGKQLIIGRVHKNDQILYQSERYHHSTFGYEIPVNRDGEYVLVLKFSEVYFNSPGMKVFDVVLNKAHTVVSQLDIFSKVGKGAAHDEHIPFTIRGNTLVVGGETTSHDGKIKLEFVKGYKDNPKINAIYVLKGTINDVPPLIPPTEEMSEEEEEEEDLTASPTASKKTTAAPVRRPSGPRLPNPYENDEGSMIPIFVAIGAFIPMLFCLCKL